MKAEKEADGPAWGAGILKQPGVRFSRPVGTPARLRLGCVILAK